MTDNAERGAYVDISIAHARRRVDEDSTPAKRQTPAVVEEHGRVAVEFYGRASCEQENRAAVPSGPKPVGGFSAVVLALLAGGGLRNLKRRALHAREAAI